ncbi:hypothetical protein GCM10010277_84790 [Streptomyces longisporoflavus]|uniref:hypothetical protein n=1 Tax=Streptomyces longisporoflavus TaxID=28044 RepID=UPI0019B4961E|nr:hypothetical protein [Streptomyces longisporoflavus]GGV72180.1 hypothetical protein GCM10010277_84790 [Streptomyces longisporoflavus]
MTGLPALPPPPAAEPARQAPAPLPGRLGPTHTLILLVAFPALGTALFLNGTPTSDILILLGGCGGVGAAVLTAAGGGRRLMAVLVEAAVRSGAGK